MVGCALLALIGVSAVPAVPAAQAVGPAACPRVMTESVPVPATVHVIDAHINVILPVGYCTSSQHYPVLYLLHGAGDTYKSWVANTDAVSASSPYPLIIVMPDGGRNSQAGWYSDWVDGSYQWESFHTKILPSFVNLHFRTRPDDLAIAGLSMGGFGALSYAGRHRGMFKAAASFSGAVDMRYAEPISGIAFGLLHSFEGVPNDQVWGNQLVNEPTWRAHNPRDLIPALAGTKLLLATGMGTPGGAQGDNLADLPGYLIETAVWQMNLGFAATAAADHVPVVQDFYPGGYHGWPYWQADLHWALPQLVAILGGPVP
jgi:S-formylglutathione hydrolase FrmB